MDLGGKSPGVIGGREKKVRTRVGSDFPIKEENIDIPHQEIQSVTSNVTFASNVTIASNVTLADVDEMMIIETDVVPKKPSLSGKNVQDVNQDLKARHILIVLSLVLKH